ncbi:TspO/MBR family protein [Methylobacterium nonmethylotrophicum]|uniref:Tryptophan-rich sensory protein n=1 Tax=Methylobacterium nonmethylotrophicum TaxID=1141884 RepID=A0A4Z0NLL5_9HYPH|nr:TspO/MBR family protein [Methylobacterium nonmethylotrophicum]TGD97376.1 tryptophan-rich sensory protein [Methylobacterium nonmethylotrophicum]
MPPTATLPRTGPVLAPLPRLLAATLPVAAVAVVGSLSTTSNIPTWYAGLAKPVFTPPNWLFPVAWTILYTLIAWSGWRMLGTAPATGGLRRTRALALGAFFVQLALNGAWTPVFFGAHDLAGGLVVVVALLAMILWTIRLFLPLDRAAALVLVPYAAWVSYATALNAAIWWMNRGV